jgi:hypothetical protein
MSDSPGTAVKTLPVEIVRDWSDPFWRLNHLYQVIDEKGEEVPFQLRPMQEEFLRAMWYMDIILKARQHGFTTAIMYFFLDQAVFNSNIRAGVIAHTLENVEILFRDKVKFAYNSLPADVRKTRKAIKVSEYGKICAKYPDKAKEIKTGALNTVHAGQIVIIESTAEGRSGDFFDKTTQAQNLSQMGRPLSKLDFKFFFYAWWRNPTYQLDPQHVPIPDKMRNYFNKILAEDGIRLTPAHLR